MRFHKLFIGVSSACFELENDEAYYCGREYSVILNGESLPELRDKNVFSLFSLEPNTEYTVKTTLDEQTLRFRTAWESGHVDIKEFGALGDGAFDNTRAIQAAINACPRHGRVIVPAGTFLTAPLHLKSHLTLELQRGATLLGSADQADYPVYPATAGANEDGTPVICAAWEGRAHASAQSLLSAHYSRDIAIVGEGTLDGNAQNAGWWIDPKSREVGRPRMLFATECESVTLHGVSVANSPSWNLHPHRSRGIGLYDICVTAPKDSPNTDGCDPESCDGVNIIGARFSVGDDAIAIKSGKAVYVQGAPERSLLRFPKASRHTIRNCLMEYAHGAVVLGSEMSGGIDTLTVRQCLFINTDRGLRIKTRRGRGEFGVIDGVTFENIVMRGVLTPFVINMFYFCDPDGKTPFVRDKSPRPVDEGTPYMGSFVFKDIVCEDCQAAAGFFYGLPEMPIGSVTVENAEISFAHDAKPGFPAMMEEIEPSARMGLYFNNVETVRLKNVTLNGVDGERVILASAADFAEE